MFQRTRQKLALGYTAVMAAILIGFGYGLAQFLQTMLLKGVDERLVQTAQEVQRSLPVRWREPRWEVLVDQSPFFQPPIGTPPFYVQWYAPDQSLVRGTLDLPEPLVPQQTWESSRGYRQFTLPWTYEGQTLGYLRVVQSLGTLDRVLGPLMWSLGLGIPLTILVIGVGGWILAGVAMEPIRASYAQLQQFAADASHELRTPITAIQTNVQVLLGEDVAPEDYRQGLRAIERVNRRMGRLVNDLLFLVRNEASAQPMTQTVNLGELLAEIVEEEGPVAQRGGIALDLRVLQNGLIHGEPDQLARLVLNLLSNAFCYTPQGGAVRLTLRREDRQLCLDIQDTGAGIAPADQARIFERFYRVDRARSRKQGGVGLGLAIAQTIAHNHGGEITLTSHLGQGSTFTVHFPLKLEVAPGFVP